MLQERIDNDKSTPASDLLLVFLLLLLAICARLIMNAVRALPGGVVWQILVVAALCGCGYILYKKRLIGYRYTLTDREPAADDLDAYGNRRQNPFPLGTFLVERTVGEKGKLYETILPEEFVSLLPPGSAESPEAKTQNFTVKPKNTAYSLLYKRDGVLRRMLLSPSEEMAQRLEKMIGELRA